MIIKLNEKIIQRLTFLVSAKKFLWVEKDGILIPLNTSRMKVGEDTSILIRGYWHGPWLNDTSMVENVKPLYLSKRSNYRGCEFLRNMFPEMSHDEWNVIRHDS